MLNKQRATAGLLSVALLVASCGDSDSITVRVPASTVWMSTDFQIPANSRVLVEAIGAISPNGSLYVDANGSYNPNWHPSYNVYRNISHCALIAKIGAGGEVHAVGESKEIYARDAGTLLLGINDNHPENNEGELEVTARILRPE